MQIRVVVLIEKNRALGDKEVSSKWSTKELASIGDVYLKDLARRLSFDERMRFMVRLSGQALPVPTW